MTIDPVLNHVSQSTINNQDGVPTIPKKIILKGVRQNNLQNLSLELPLNQMIVICGPSGSGKSSLAFETLHTEAQRRFIESLSHYAKQFIQKLPKPNLESACNLPPSIALEQKNGIRTSRSSVGTITEIQDYLRLLFDKLALPYCPLHNKPCQALDVSQASKKLIDEASLKRGYLLLPINWTRQMGLKWQGHLIQHGFYRILSIDKDSIKIININESPLPKSSSQEKKWYVILDRLEINVTDFQRICDSLENGVRLRTHLEKDWFGKNIFFFDGKDFWLRINLELQCPDCDFQPPNLSTGLFNFNSPSGACPHCKGFGNILEFDINKIIPNPNLSIQQGAIEPFTMPSAAREKRTLLKFCQKQKIPVEVPWNQLNQEHQDLIWNGDNHFKGIQGFFNKLENKKYKMHVRVFISRYRSARTCPECGGLRLRKEAYVYRVHGQGWDFFLNQQLSKLKNWFEGQSWSQYEWQMGHEIISQILARLNYLVRVGVGYLTLNRATRTLSGGEYQRIMLANQLGNELSQALYVLDEPTIGLHPQDNDQLISIIQDIKKMGNTVVLVEHDEKVIQSAEYIIEMGPGSGINGGQVMFQGRYSDFIENPHSVTAQFLRTSSSLQPPRREVSLPDYKYKLELKGACGHNLKNINVMIPLNRFVVISGVSGSGKSSLLIETLYPALARELNIKAPQPLPLASLDGHTFLKNVSVIDQSPLARNSRSLPVTYLKMFDEIRNLFLTHPIAIQYQIDPGYFSLNVEGGGRCPHCKGLGFQEIDLVFLDTVILPCEHCQGERYKAEVKQITYKGYHIIDVLNMTFDQAFDLFADRPGLRYQIQTLRQVGLGYLKLGQPISTLSGGEAQRLKIAKELLFSSPKRQLYLLDEPTTGLHFREVEQLINVLHQLVDSGASVVMIEHNLQVLRSADWIIELGPEGGDNGGYLLAQGSPYNLKSNKHSITGKYL